jgi:hypothetical protein
MKFFCSKPVISTTASPPPPAIYTSRLTTPYPGLLHNSVAPAEENEPKLEALTELAEEGQEAAEEQTTDESESEYAEASSTVEQTSSSDSEQQEESLPPTGRHHTVQAKRLEDLFPLERTRPINWPSTQTKAPTST